MTKQTTKDRVAAFHASMDYIARPAKRLGLKIHTSHIYPPIPTRAFDWVATLDDYDGGDPIGYGPTKAAAIKDLLMVLELDDDEPEVIDDE